MTFPIVFVIIFLSTVNVALFSKYKCTSEKCDNKVTPVCALNSRGVIQVFLNECQFYAFACAHKHPKWDKVSFEKCVGVITPVRQGRRSYDPNRPFAQFSRDRSTTTTYRNPRRNPITTQRSTSYRPPWRQPAQAARRGGTIMKYHTSRASQTSPKTYVDVNRNLVRPNAPLPRRRTTSPRTPSKRGQA